MLGLLTLGLLEEFGAPPPPTRCSAFTHIRTNCCQFTHLRPH